MPHRPNSSTLQGTNGRANSPSHTVTRDGVNSAQVEESIARARRRVTEQEPGSEILRSREHDSTQTEGMFASLYATLVYWSASRALIFDTSQAWCKA